LHLVAKVPLTKSAIHYYVVDTDELLEEAMARHVDVFATQPKAGSLWFECAATAARRGHLDAVDQMLPRSASYSSSCSNR
jgi:DNA-binding transcriptional regulator YbjK